MSYVDGTEAFHVAGVGESYRAEYQDASGQWHAGPWCIPKMICDVGEKGPARRAVNLAPGESAVHEGGIDPWMCGRGLSEDAVAVRVVGIYNVAKRSFSFLYVMWEPEGDGLTLVSEPVEFTV